MPHCTTNQNYKLMHGRQKRKLKTIEVWEIFGPKSVEVCGKF
jgi:hypothetical protein